MTSDELRKLLNDTFELKEWPKTYEVDAETYGNVCNYILRAKLNLSPIRTYENYEVFSVSLGKHGGIMFKNVELILKAK